MRWEVSAKTTCGDALMLECITHIWRAWSHTYEYLTRDFLKICYTPCKDEIHFIFVIRESSLSSWIEIMDTLLRGTVKVLLLETSVCHVLWSGKRPDSVMDSGKLPWNLPETTSGLPQKRSGIGNGYTCNMLKSTNLGEMGKKVLDRLK